MLDKKIIVNKHFLKIKDKKIIINVISDLHLCKSFNNAKLNIIKNCIKENKPDYLFVAGDIVDSTNFLYENKELKDMYINFFAELSKITKVIMVLGNHDRYYVKKNKKVKIDKINDFFTLLGNINNIVISCNSNYYEDNNIYVTLLDMPSNYYLKNDIKRLIQRFKKNNFKSKNKINILLTHSPINITDKRIKEYINCYDLIITGHMHKGAIPFNLANRLPGNRGIIGPNRMIFPKNSRGLIKLDNNNYLLVCGGITKIHEFSHLKFLNRFFYMDLDDIHIK